MAAMVFVLLGEEMDGREFAFFIATFTAMAFFLYAFVRVAVTRHARSEVAAQARRSRLRPVLVAIYAASLLVTLVMMWRESGSIASWAGFLLCANLAGCALFYVARPVLTGR